MNEKTIKIPEADEELSKDDVLEIAESIANAFEAEGFTVKPGTSNPDTDWYIKIKSESDWGDDHYTIGITAPYCR